MLWASRSFSRTMAARGTTVAPVTPAGCAALVSACGPEGRLAVLRRRPIDPPAPAESNSLGTEGDAVSRGAVAGLVYRGMALDTAKRRSEGGPPIASPEPRMTPSNPEPEWVYSCKSVGEEDVFLIGFRYPDGTGEQVEVGNRASRWGAVNLRTGKAYEVTGGLTDELDRDLRGEP
jgi:hypothetical protein